MKIKPWYCILLLIMSSATFGQTNKIIKKGNIVYGSVSNLALLMDVYQPERSNNKAIIFIHGSAWGYVYPKGYEQPQLKEDYNTDTSYGGKWVRSLLQKGYSVFVINHRFVPQFQFPEIFADCQRAVRFVRYHAKEYNIDPAHIGAMGHSSGGNLSAMLGVADGIKPGAKGIDSLSASVQAVVTLATPFDLADINKPEDSAVDRSFVLSVVNAYLGGLPGIDGNGGFVSNQKSAAASPPYHVTKDDAPMLIYYSDDDPVIPVRHQISMYNKLKETGVPVKLVERKNQGHGPMPDMEEVDTWFKQHLK